jgi:hypothetical protein
MLETVEIGDLQAAGDFFSAQLAAADIAERTGLCATVNRWWSEIETLIKTRGNHGQG